MIFTTYKELKENKYDINSWSVDVISVYDALRKVFKKYIDNTYQDYEQLTQSFYTRNDRFLKVAYDFSFYLMKYLADNNASSQKNDISKVLVENKKLFSTLNDEELREKVLTLAKQIFRITHLDGSTRDVLLLVDLLNSIDNSKMEIIEKLDFNFHPFNGCDMPS
ncbi:hypothetical protein [Mycoplasma sp. CSL7503-lung]|uniref:hypothetical protein n=1 Tax=Mycoplasma sp. CSL7503-lung TaxID=536372 RepID=UPI0021CE5F04|nr:hypothetical protein [Mycoplasma sp. CSL7503-lung]MCU4706401.1 hypothetical protein [Mycoplasma sp. CSL7503-lung]